jgi:TonB family protein
MRNLTWIFLFASAAAAAQPRSKDTVVHAFNEYLLATSNEQAVFTGYAIKMGDRWAAQVYDNKENLIARGSYASRKCTDKNGWFTFYYPEGKRAASGQYFRDRKDGNWRIWYPNGQLRDSLAYEKDRPNGSYYTYFENGKISGKGSFQNGFENGTWTWYHPNGQVSSIEEYIKGDLAGQQCFDTAGRKQLTNCKQYAFPSNLQQVTLNDMFSDPNILPKDKAGRPIDGTVTVKIHITETGELKELAILSADHPLLDSVARKMLSNIQWNPAFNHNRPIVFDRTILFRMGKPYPKQFQQGFQPEHLPTPYSSGPPPLNFIGDTHAYYRDLYGITY